MYFHYAYDIIIKATHQGVQVYRSEPEADRLDVLGAIWNFEHHGIEIRWEPKAQVRNLLEGVVLRLQGSKYASRGRVHLLLYDMLWP